jgi:hypothetical protein
MILRVRKKALGVRKMVLGVRKSVPGVRKMAAGARGALPVDHLALLRGQNSSPANHKYQLGTPTEAS